MVALRLVEPQTEPAVGDVAPADRRVERVEVAPSDADDERPAVPDWAWAPAEAGPIKPSANEQTAMSVRRYAALIG